MWSVLTILCLSCGCGLMQDSTINPEFSERLSSIYQSSVQTVAAGELTAMVKRGAGELDTRERDESDTSHIRAARHVGFIWFSMRKVYAITKTDTVVVYRAIGNRSELIGENLQ